MRFFCLEISVMTELQRFLQRKINECESVFENANTNSFLIVMKGMVKHGGELNALLMNIGKRQAYIEVLDYIREK